LPTTRTNTTPEADTHPADHNNANAALNALQDQVTGIQVGAVLPTGTGPGTVMAGDDARVAKVFQMELAASVAATAQEGGHTILGGQFVARSSTVEFDVAVLGSSAGWGTAWLALYTGVLPAGTPPVGWEGRALNRISRRDATSDQPLTGVTEFARHVVGTTGRDTPASVGRTVIRTGLTVGRTYTLELAAFGISYFRATPVTLTPTRVTVTSDGLHAWLACGSSKVKLMQLGSAEYAYYSGGVSSRAAVVAEVTMPAAVQGVHLAPGEARLAAVTSTQLALLDTATYVVTTATPPTAPIRTRAVWTSATQVWVGSATNGNLYRYDTTAGTWTTVTVAAGASYIIPLVASADGATLWCTDYLVGQIYRVNTATLAVTSVYALGATGPFSAGVNTAGIVFVDEAANQVRVVSPAGVLVGSIALPASPNVGAYIAVTADGTRAYWTRGARVGWGWLTTFNKINDFAASTYNLGTLGGIALTANEGVVFCRPEQNLVSQWPGGTFRVRPEPADATSLGSEHAIVTIRGADLAT